MDVDVLCSSVKPPIGSMLVYGMYFGPTGFLYNQSAIWACMLV